jgi:hypothetical protein
VQFAGYKLLLYSIDVFRRHVSINMTHKLLLRCFNHCKTYSKYTQMCTSYTEMVFFGDKHIIISTVSIYVKITSVHNSSEKELPKLFKI